VLEATRVAAVTTRLEQAFLAELAEDARAGVGGNAEEPARLRQRAADAGR